MDSQNATQAQLESALKATLARLSHILAFQARLQQQGTAQYAPPAPIQLAEQLKVDVARFDQVCDDVERKLLRAIAVIERDVRKATGASPPPVPSPEQPTVKAEPGAEAILPFGLPSSLTEPAAAAVPAAAGMSIDLTNSPSPTSTSLPFQLPGTATPASVLTSNSNPIPTAQTNTAAESVAGDDLNALLSSLNVPPFGGIDPSADLTSTSNAPDTAFVTNSAFPDLSLEALDSLLSGSAAAASGTSAPPASASVPTDLSSLGLDFASVLSAPPLSGPTAAPAASSAPSLDLGSFDFSSLGLAGSAEPAASSGAGGAGGLGGLDLTGLGDLDFGSFGTEGGGQDGGTGAILATLCTLDVSPDLLLFPEPLASTPAQPTCWVHSYSQTLLQISSARRNALLASPTSSSARRSSSEALNHAPDMPVPPLPLELVRLILSFAAASLPKVERRENCLAFAQVCKAGLAAEPVEEDASLDNQVATLRLRVTGLKSANSAQSAEMEIMQTNMASVQAKVDEMMAERQPALVIEMCKAALEALILDNALVRSDTKEEIKEAQRRLKKLARGPSDASLTLRLSHKKKAADTPYQSLTDNWLELPKAIKDNIQDFPSFDVEFIDFIQNVSLDPPPADPVLLAIARLTKTDWLIDLNDTRNEGAHPHGTVAQTENVLQRAGLASSAAKVVLKRLPNHRFSKTQPIDPTDLLNELSQEWHVCAL
ncbi:hypothetical protein OF846_003864 [Rhodotorula toruloides]|nr:hypothetical protein OF846_003864 [Rhodotorula toruloides]